MTTIATPTSVIDLTIQENITATRPQTQQRRVRAPCKCGYCGEAGHTMRMCTDPYIQGQYRLFNHKLKLNESIDSLVTWFMDHEEKPLKMLSSHFLKISYHKQTNQDEIIAKLRSYIGDFNHSARLSKMNYLNRILESFHKHESREYLQERSVTVQRFISYHNQFEERATQPEIDGFGELLRICELTQQPPNQISYALFHLPASRLARYAFISRLNWNTLNRFSKFVNYIAHERAHFIYEQNISRIRNETIQYHRLTPVEQIEYTYCSFDANSSVKPIEESIECPICMDTADKANISMIQCGHSFCTRCITTTILKMPSGKRCNCPMCRTPIDTIMTMDLSV